MTRRLLRAREVQEITGLSRTKAYELMHALGSVRVIGRATRVSVERLGAYMRERKAAAPSGEPAVILAQSLTSLTGIEPPTTAGVYAVQGAGGFIKIGRGKNIAARLRKLQNAHPVPIKLIAVLSSDPRDELAHHRRWAHLRRQGEWFEADHDLVEHLAQMRVAPP